MPDNDSESHFAQESVLGVTSRCFPPVSVSPPVNEGPELSALQHRGCAPCCHTRVLWGGGQEHRFWLASVWLQAGRFPPPPGSPPAGKDGVMHSDTG